MKKLPYKYCYVVLQINNEIEKIFFEPVIDYEDYCDPDFDEHKKCMAQVAAVRHKAGDELLMLLSQSYLNSKAVINEFKRKAKRNFVRGVDACVLLVVDMQEDTDGGGSIKICTDAFDDKRDAFNYIAEFASDSSMEKFVFSLSNKMQDILFDI